MIDPTRAKLTATLKDAAIDLDADRMDIEGAIYWFAAHYHGGQSSNLYSALSTSKYRPGLSCHGPDAGSTEWELYQVLIDAYAPDSRG